MQHPKSRKKEIIALLKQLEAQLAHCQELEEKGQRQQAKIQRYLNGEVVEEDGEEKAARKKKKKKHS